MRTYVKYAAGLIVLYLIVEHYTGFGSAVTNGATGAATVVRAFQGR